MVDKFGFGKFDELVRCPICQGKGRTRVFCEECGGTGRVDRQASGVVY